MPKGERVEGGGVRLERGRREEEICGERRRKNKRRRFGSVHSEILQSSFLSSGRATTRFMSGDKITRRFRSKQTMTLSRAEKEKARKESRIERGRGKRERTAPPNPLFSSPPPPFH